MEFFLTPKIILTCEHGGSEIPTALKKKFITNTAELNSHHSLDYGAAKICSELKTEKQIESHINLLSRLLIDMNRKEEAFEKKSKSLIKRGLSKEDLNIPLKSYQNYRKKAEDSIKKSISNKKPVYIFSVHSFVPVYNGKTRATDIGLLFRTDKIKEAAIAQKFKTHFKASKKLEDLNVHYNRPYRGFTDCFLNDLLDKYGNSPYVLGGCFLEFNGSLLKKNSNKVIDSLRDFFKNLS